MASAELPEDRVNYARDGELSPNPVNESTLDFRAGVQRSQHSDRGNRGAGKLGGHITGNTGKSQHMDVECLTDCAHRFEIFTAIVPQTELQVDAFWVALHRSKVNWVLDADIRSFFDTIDHGWMMRFLEHRIADRRLLRLIRKWLTAGVIGDG